MRVLLDEMYGTRLAERLRAAGVDAVTVTDLRLTGAADAVVFSAAVAGGYVVLTENVADFVRLAAQHITTGGHHCGVLIALSSRFSRRPEGVLPLATAIEAVASDDLDDRVVYLMYPGD